MRVLCTTLPEYGHFHTLVPLAQALVDAGHEVAFATAAEFAPRVERAGFIAFAAGIGFDEQIDRAVRRFPRDAAIPFGEERFHRFVPKMLAGVAAPPRAADLVPLVERCQPDLVVHGEAELAGPVAAEVAGIPYAAQSVGVLRPLDMARLAREVLDPLCRSYGVDVGPFGGLFRYLYLDVCPPALQSPEIAHVAVAHPVDAEGKPLSLRRRPRQGPAGGIGAYDGAADEGLPPWVDSLGRRPTVYVTFGTINRDPTMFDVVLEALRDEPIDLAITVGRHNDPAAFGPQPANVHIEHYIPQSLFLPYCDLVVNHAGSILPVLGHGLPLLTVPQKGNEFQNAAACVSCGAGRRLETAAFAPETVRGEVRTLLDDPSYRDSARRVAQEIALMPGPDEGVRLLEQLHRERRPVVRQPVAPRAAT